MRRGLPHLRRRWAGLCFRRVRWLPGFVGTLVLASLGSALCLGAAEPGQCERAKPPLDRARLPVASERARLIVLADMGNEPDEEQQMLHLLICANELDVEGLIAVTGKYLCPEDKNPYRQKLHPELFTRLIDGYAKVYPNLKLHAAGSTDPDQDAIRCSWWFYPEAGRRPYGKELPVEEATAEQITITIPSDASGSELHLILEVWDRSRIVPLAAYRRAVINVTN